MENPTHLFAEHLVKIYFLYGLAFLITGVAFFLESSRASAFPAAQALPLLSAFGLIHGAHEWIEMFQLIDAAPVTRGFQVFRILMLAVSFFMLMEFGLRTLLQTRDERFLRISRLGILAVFLLGQAVLFVVWGRDWDLWMSSADAWCRYSLAIPGAFLAAAGLSHQGRLLTKGQKNRIVQDLQIVSVALFLYGIPGQFFVGASPLPPSNVLNSELFWQTFGFPIQLFRTVMATLTAVFTVRAIRCAEEQRQRRMQELHKARLETQDRLNQEMAKREKLQEELLRQIVEAQEEERQYIARELHDTASQALTALSWGLATVDRALPERAEEAQRKVRELRGLTDQVMKELRQLTTRLRPAILDELGLVAALISYADDCSNRFSFVADVNVNGARRKLPSPVKTALYRSAQEAITNVAKHAEATEVQIELTFEKQEVYLRIVDDGIGMDVSTAQQAAVNGTGWGLAGIRERLQLVDGRMAIKSSPGEGTELFIVVPTADPSRFDDQDQN